METTKDAFLCHSSSFRFSTNIKHRFFIYSSAVVVTTYIQVSETHKAGSSSFRNTQVSVTTYKLIQDTGSSNTGYENDRFSDFLHFPWDQLLRCRSLLSWCSLSSAGRLISRLAIYAFSHQECQLAEKRKKIK